MLSEGDLAGCAPLDGIDPPAGPDDSWGSNPQPASSDIVSGPDITNPANFQPSFWYGFWDDAPLHSGTFFNSGNQQNWHTNWQDCSQQPCPIARHDLQCDPNDPLCGL